MVLIEPRSRSRSETATWLLVAGVTAFFWLLICLVLGSLSIERWLSIREQDGASQAARWLIPRLLVCLAPGLSIILFGGYTRVRRRGYGLEAVVIVFAATTFVSFFSAGLLLGGA